MNRWYLPLDSRPGWHEAHVPGVDEFVVDVVDGLLAQIIERRCPRCERLAGYAHADWTAPALMFPPCGRIECLLATLRAHERLWGWIGALPAYPPVRFDPLH